MILLSILGFFAYRSINSLNEAIRWKKHTQEVLLQLDETLTLVIDAETGGRGFVITGNESFLEPYTQTKLKIDGILAELRGMLTDNPSQKQTLAILEDVINKKLFFIKQTVELRRDQSFSAALEQINTGQGKFLMEEIRRLVKEMKDKEKVLLLQREADLDKSLDGTYWMLILGSLAGIVSLGLANFAIFREVGKRASAEEKLKNSNKDLEIRVEERTRELSATNEELKQQIKEREQAENRRRVALEVGSLGTWKLNLDKDDGEMDERGLEIFGLTKEDFNGSSKLAFSRIVEEDAPVVDEKFRKAVSEKTNFDAEFRIRDSKGWIRWNNCNGQPQLDENGNVTHIVGFCRDITESKQSEIALRNSEEFNRSIFENSPDCVKVLELDGTIHSVNTNGLCILEIDDLASFVGKQWIDLWEGDEKELACQAVETARKGKSASFEGYCKTAKGTLRYWDVSIAPIFDVAGKPIRLVSTSRDITERREAESEREELLKREQAARKDAEIANRMRDEFLATVSHELRAPLNAILGWGRLLEKGKLDETTTEKAIDTIVRNAESQNRLIEDLLDVSRIISGKLRLEVITIKPINIVESALETVRPAADAKGITLEIKDDRDVSHISGDPNRLQQVIWNLVSNAIKFTPNDGRVTLEIERQDDFVEISVKDTGVGIKEEFLPHVFDRFRQADASSIRKFGGLGLGLAIVRHITEMHGGTVDVFSEGEGKGATFTVRLPLITSPIAESEAETAMKLLAKNDIPEINLDGLLILVVDDEEDTCQLLVQSLTFHGATVISADSVKNALAQIEEQNPDVLVSDIGMPGEDGYSLIRKVRALPDDQQRNMPAIALTAFTRAQDRMRALATGFQNHVSKPVEPDELATVIASLTGRLQINE
ncbi:MAG: CHASE3 domain-containing protein [Acidobacteriota bacterium]|nr:CHASE3 domain-containing protein [Acidobacteriota bacterium]